MVSLKLWAALQTLQFTGAIFVVFGDWAGQLPPISDQESLDIWKKLPTSDFMHQLVNGLSIQVNKFRRWFGGKANDTHFKFVKSIYPYDSKEDLKEALAAARTQYPLKPFDYAIGTTLCLTNKCRTAVNGYVNKTIAPANHVMIRPMENTRAAKTPQNMRIWPGIILVAAQTDKKNVKNGTRYRVNDLTASTVNLVQITDNDTAAGAPFGMTYEEVGKKLLLSHAITYGSSQARTIYGPLRLLQTDHKMMTLRRLIVGLGRAPDGGCVQVH